MAKSGLSFDRYLQRLTIRGCQVLCSLFLLFSLSGALEAVNAQTLVWPFRDGCSDGYDIQLRIFELDNNLVWPSSTHVYILGGTTQTYRLSCTPQAQVCYGAKDDPANPNAGYWGVGIDGDEGCEDCCYRCPISGDSQVRTRVLRCDDGGNGGGGGDNNDAFASRIRLSGSSGQAEGSNDGASKESGEPNHAGSRGGASVWWTWTAPAAGTVTFDTRGSDFDTLLAVYTGSRINSLTKVAADDDTHGRQSEVSFRAVEGRTYHVAVDGYGGKTGNVVLNWEGPGSDNGGGSDNNDAFASRIRLSGASGQAEGSNGGASKESGEPNHAGSRGGASVWWTWTAPATGTVTFDTRGSDFDTLLAVYTGSRINSLTKVAADDDTHGRQSEVSFKAAEGRTYHIAVDGYGGKTGSVVLNWEGPGGGNGGGSGNNDAFASRIRLSGASGQAEGSNDGASKESGEPNHAGSRGGASVWWTWTAPATGTVTFDTRGSDFDTLLAVYTGSRINSLTKVAADDDTHGRQSEVSFRAVEGRTYHIAVDGYGGASGDVVLNWEGPSGSGSQPSPDPDNPGDPHDGRCISGETITHPLVDGHVAVGHRITGIAPAPSVAGLPQGFSGPKNSNGEWHGRRLWVSGSHVDVEWFDNGTLLESCGYDNGDPDGFFTPYANGKKEGVRYWFSGSGSWDFETFRSDTLHGPSGGYDSDGDPDGFFTPYANGKKEGVRYWFSGSGSWDFETFRADTLHGPSGSYNAAGQKDGCFGSYTNGQGDGCSTYYSDGVAQ